MLKRMKKYIVIFLCLAMILAITSCQTQEVNPVDSSAEKQAIYKAGVYTASSIGKNGDVKVEVVFTDDKIDTVKIVEHKETQGVSDTPIITIPEIIVENQSLLIDSISGATVTSDAILAAVKDCVTQAGGNVDALMVEIKNASNENVEEVSYDIVVVGGGAAGSSAALAASEKSDSVLLLEKTSAPMGAGTLAGGMFAAESSLQKEEGKTVDKEWLFDQYMIASDGYMNSVLVRKIIDESSKTIDWLLENGMQLNLVDSGSGFSFANVGKPSTLHGYNEGGIVAITKLIKEFEQNNGTVMFSTPATELLTDDSGKVVGVVATKNDGSKLKVNAKAVILATGGFGGNEDMMREQFGDKFTMGEVATNTGDGIRMAWGAGAAEYGAATTHYFWETFKGEEFGALIGALGDDFFALTDFTFYPHLRVNMLGQRHCDETTVSDFATHGAQVHMQPNQTEYLILDTLVLNQIAEKGYVSVEDHFGTFKNNRNFYMEFNEPNDTDLLIEKENTPMDYTPLLEGALTTGVVFKGETLEELAENIGIDSVAFTASVEQYNNAIETGEDEQFFSNTTRLVPVVQGPYYAVKYVARNLGTLGGIAINENIEAVDSNGAAIPGLYVAGADAGGMYGKSYVNFEGGTLGFAYTSGRLAGENANSYINK